MSNTSRKHYFEEEDIFHLVISDEPEYNSFELSPNITVELNEAGEVIGVEVLSASTFFTHLPPPSSTAQTRTAHRNVRTTQEDAKTARNRRDRLKQRTIGIGLGCTVLALIIFPTLQMVNYFPSSATHDNRIAIQPQFGEASRFSGGLAIVYDQDSKSYSYIRKNGERAIKNLKYTPWYFSEGRAVVISANDKYGYIDQTGKLVIQLRFDDADYFSEGLARVNIGKKTVYHGDEFHNFSTREGGKWGYINKSGNFVIKPKFVDAANFSEGLAGVQIATPKGKNGGL